MKTKKLLAATAALLLTGSVNSQSCATHCPAFNGTTSYVSTINSLGTSGTLEAWIYLNSLPDGVTSLGAEIFNTSTTFDQSQTDLYIDPSGHLVLANYNTGANDHFYLTGSTVLSTGKWYHVAGTWETNSSNLTANVYVNGCYDGTYGPSSAHTWDNTGSPSLLAIGGWPASVAHYGSTPWALDGMIDEARSWSVARTQCQIADNMEQLDFFGSDHASLQCYYQFNESTLPTTPPKTEDSFSGNNDGTLVNIGSWPASAAPVISWNTSPYNRVSSSCMQMYSGNISSVLFNGSTNYVTTNSYHPGTSGSMEAWINMSSLPDGVTSYGAEIFNTSITYDQTQTDLFVTTGGNLVLSNYNTTANNYLTLNGSTVLSAGQWYHVAATWETSGGNVTAYLYVNGCLDGTYGPSSAHTWDNTGSSALAIGGWPASIANYGSTHWALTGNIDEVKIWDVQRSQCDIIANMYNSVPTSYPSSLKCYYKFNDNSGSSPANSVSGGPTGSFSSAAPSWDSNVAPIDPSCTSGCRLANATGIKENWNNGSLKVYPNPNSGNFTVEINTAVRQNVKIYDVTGAVVLDQVVDGKTNINAGNLNAGIYTISITGKDGAVTQKLIIMK